MVTKKTLRTREGEQAFKKNKFGTAVDLNKCLKQIKLPSSLHTWAPISDLPSNISTTV